MATIKKVWRERKFRDGKLVSDEVIIDTDYKMLTIPTEEVPTLIEKLQEAHNQKTNELQ